MNPSSRRNLRWLVPILAVAGVAGISSLPNLVSSATASPPNLPALTPAELLAKARTAQVTALSGTIKLTANLGLPSLDSLNSLGGGGAGTSVASLLAGDHSAHISIDGPDHVRIATMAPMAETNWIRNGNDVWSYDSSTLTATHATMAAGGTDKTATDATGTNGTGPTETSVADPVRDTPIQFAQHLLDQVTPSTAVTVDTATRVAGRPVYQLVLSPNDNNSTVGSVTLSIDAATGLPLDVKIVARSSGSTALELGFTDISFDVPSASTFAFTPPPGSTVVEAKSPSDLLSTGGDTHDRHDRKQVPATTTDGSGGISQGASGDSTPGSGSLSTNNYTVLGKDWTSVVVISNSSLQGQLGSLLNSAPQVTVGSIHGRLISTTLFNVLVLDDGRIAVGAVNADTLQSLVAAA